MKNKENHDVMHEEAACEYGTNVRSEWKIEWKNLEQTGYESQGKMILQTFKPEK